MEYHREGDGSGVEKQTEDSKEETPRACNEDNANAPVKAGNEHVDKLYWYGVIGACNARLLLTNYCFVQRARFFLVLWSSSFLCISS